MDSILGGVFLLAVWVCAGTPIADAISELFDRNK